MRDSARWVLLYWSAVLLCIALLPTPAVAAPAQCSDIYPGAEIGPPPEWTFWGDGSACYVRWTPETSQHEDKLLEQCRNTSGARFVHFERDKGAGHSICLFKILGLIAPSKEPNPLPSTSQGLTPVASPNLQRLTEHVIPKRKPKVPTSRKKPPAKKQVIKKQQPQVQAREG
jgi:hypothetical protein